MIIDNNNFRYIKTLGNCGENTAKKLNITREEQDEYGINSYRRSAKAYEEGAIQPELVEVHIEQKRGKAPPLIVKEDAEFRKINFDKFTKLATVFQKEGKTNVIRFQKNNFLKNKTEYRFRPYPR